MKSKLYLIVVFIILLVGILPKYVYAQGDDALLDLEAINTSINNRVQPHIIRFSNDREALIAKVSNFSNIYFFKNEELDSISILIYHHAIDLDRCYFTGINGTGYLDKDFNKIIIDSTGQISLSNLMSLSSSDDLVRLPFTPKSAYKNKLLEIECGVSSFAKGEITFHIAKYGLVHRIFSFQNGITTIYDGNGNKINSITGKVIRIFNDRYYLTIENRELEIINEFGEIAISRDSYLIRNSLSIKQLGFNHGLFKMKDDSLDLFYILDFSNGEVIDSVFQAWSINENWYVKKNIEGRFIVNVKDNLFIQVDQYSYHVLNPNSENFQYSVKDSVYIRGSNGEILDTYEGYGNLDRVYYNSGWYLSGDTLLVNYRNDRTIDLNIKNSLSIKNIMFYNGIPKLVLVRCYSSQENKAVCLYNINNQNVELLNELDYIFFCDNRLVYGKKHGGTWKLYHLKSKN